MSSQSVTQKRIQSRTANSLGIHPRRRGRFQRVLSVESLEGRCLLSATDFLSQAGSYNDAGTGAYALNAVFTTADDQVNTPGADATLLTLDSTGSVQTSGTLEASGDRDVFAVSLAGQGSLDLALTAIDTSLDTYLRVYDSQGTLVAENDDENGSLNSALTLDTEGGTYYLQAGSYDDAGTGAYSLKTVFTLEDVADGTLSGTVFNDHDGDGQQGTDESVLSDWKVYLDANDNGQLDTTEVLAVSDADGNYKFENLASGAYRIGQVIPAGWEQTTPVVADQVSSRVINGTPTSDFPSVGMVGAWGSGFCSGTLITGTFVLTAAHCAEGVGDEEGNFVVGGQSYTTSRVYLHPGWNDSVFGTDAAHDIALYELSQAVWGVTPSPIFTGIPSAGDQLTLVGFGAGGDGSTGHNGDFGTKRVGTTPIDQVTSRLIHWSFDNNSESNTAPGDSGSPAFLLVDGVYQVAGVTSGGNQYDAGIGDNSYDTRVDAYRDWIEQLTGNTGGDGGGGFPIPDSGFYEVTLGVSEALGELDFGNRQRPATPVDDQIDGPGNDTLVLAFDSTGSVQANGTLEASGDRDVFAVSLGGLGQPGFGTNGYRYWSRYLPAGVR